MSQVVPPLVLLEFDAEAERQLVALLDALPRLARANGVVPSPALLRLAAALSDRTRAQETAGRDDGAVALQGVGVRLLHPYDEVAQLLGGVSRDTVERLVRSGMLPAVRVGRRCLVRHDDVVAYVASLPTSVAS